MPAFSMTKNWSNGTTPTEGQLDDIKNSTEVFLNVTKVDSDNINASAVDAVNLSSEAVLTSRITDLNVTTAKIADDSVTAVKVAANAAVAANFVASNVTSAKLGAASVTRIKQETNPGAVVSSDSGNFSTTNNGSSDIDVTNLSISVTVTNRGVLLFLQPSSASASTGYLGIVNATTGGGVTGYQLKRDGTEIANFYINGHNGGTSTTSRQPCGMVKFFDDPGAGTYTYKFSYDWFGSSGSANVLAVVNSVKLVAIPL